MSSIEARAAITRQGTVGPCRLIVEDGRILAVEEASGLVPDATIAPGFVDLQVNGHEDVDVATAEGERQWRRMDELLLAQGVTAWCPTLVSAPLDVLERSLERIADASARSDRGRPHIAGAHLEGPFITVAAAHRSEDLRPIDEEWLTRLPPIVSVVTLAPEQPGACRAIRRMAECGTVVGLGHSSASTDSVAAAAEAGAVLVTHLFNAMDPFDHRRPGLAGAALADPRLSVSVIADLVHVHPVALAATFAAKGSDRVALITDAIAWRTGRLGGATVTVADESPGIRAPRLRDGRLAGSVLTMDRAVANVVERVGVPLEAAVTAASGTPARLLGLRDRGTIEPGARADLVMLDEALDPRATWVAGELAWEA